MYKHLIYKFMKEQFQDPHHQHV